MDYIHRALEHEIKRRLLEFDKAVVLYGPRQSGKTTLCKQVASDLGVKHLYVSGDEITYLDVLSSRDLFKLKAFVSGYRLLIIDEAQRIPDIGIAIKLIVDNIKDLAVLATGSSSIGIAQKASEPLTGRKWTYVLYPLWVGELQGIWSDFDITNRLLELMLVYGMYPEVFLCPSVEEKRRLLVEIAGSYLYKDVLELARVDRPDKIIRLLRLLAYQVGSQVSINELAISLGISRTAVERYIHLLEEAFVVFRLTGFSRNLRKEMTKMDKIYFHDVGIRNALIDNFKPIDMRDDVGKLWENFIIAERMKKLHYEGEYALCYFWRVTTGGELDYVEESGGNLTGYEIKWKAKKCRVPESWEKAYPSSRVSVVSRDNFLRFVGRNF